MDSITPVGAQVKTPDAFQTLNSILGLQSRQLDIQKQQQDLQTATAGAQRETQAMQERLAIQKMMQSGVDDQGNSIRGEDGQPDVAKVLPALGRVAPLTGQNYAQSIVKTQNDRIGLEASSASLDAQERAMLMGPVQAAANDPKMKAADVNAAIDNLLEAHPEMANAAGYLKSLVSTHLDNLPPDKRASALQIVAAHMQGGQAVQTQPQGATIDTGGTVQPGVTAPAVAGGGFTPAGTAVPKTTPPTITQAPSGQLVRVSPGAGSMAVIGAPANVNQTTAQVETQRGLAAGVTQRVSQAQAAANNTVQAQDALTRAKAILESSDLNTGAGFERMKTLKNVFASAGIDTEGATDANGLVKNLARYEAARATQAGLGGTDAARELAHSGSPNTQIDKGALIGIVNQSLATERALAAYANKQSKVSDPAKLAQNESEFRSIPNLVEGYEYGMARTPEEANAFLAKHGLTPKQMLETRQRIKQFEAP